MRGRLYLYTAKYMYGNSFPHRPAKTVPFVILPCITPGNFTHQRRVSGQEMVNWAFWDKMGTAHFN